MSNFILRLIFAWVGKTSEHKFKIVFSNGAVFETGAHGASVPPAVTIVFKKWWVQWWSIIFFYEGFLEMYVEGHIDILGDGALNKMAYTAYSAFRAARENGGGSRLRMGNPFLMVRKWWQEKIQNNTNRERSMRNADFHYSNNPFLFETILGETVGYSEGYWTPDTQNINQAKHNNYEYICRKLRLQPGMRVLEVGSGWGFLAIHMVKKYDVDVVIYNPVKVQNDYMQKRFERNGVADRITIILGDHRDIMNEAGTFDRFVTIGVHEHHGYVRSQYALWWRSIAAALKENGIGVISTSGYLHRAQTSFFTLKYIWPGGNLPSLPDELRMLDEHDLTLVEVENLWPHYQKTSAEWDKRFNEHWPEIQKSDPKRFNERFKRAWLLYLDTITQVFWYGLDCYHITFTKGRSADNYPWTHDSKYEADFREGDQEVECYK